MLRAPKPRLTRRSFLLGVATLPAIGARAWPDVQEPPSRLFFKPPPLIESADQVLNVMEFEPLARAALPPAHFGYIATGSDDDRTMIQNHEAFSHYQIRAHRFRDLSHLRTTRAVFGQEWSSPVYLSAVSAMRAFHPEGELAVARAARSRSMQLTLSTGSSTPVEAVMAAAGRRCGSSFIPPMIGP